MNEKQKWDDQISIQCEASQWASTSRTSDRNSYPLQHSQWAFLGDLVLPGPLREETLCDSRS